MWLCSCRGRSTARRDRSGRRRTAPTIAIRGSSHRRRRGRRGPCPPGHVSADSPEYSLSCAGATLRGFGYEEQHTNMATIFIDGAVVFHVDDFGTDLDETVAVPQDGVVHTVRLVIDAEGPGTKDTPSTTST